MRASTIREDVGAKPLLDLYASPSVSRLVLQRVMEQRGNRLRLGAPMLEHERADAEQVGNVGNLGTLPRLAGVQLSSVREGLGKPS